MFRALDWCLTTSRYSASSSWSPSRGTGRRRSDADGGRLVGQVAPETGRVLARARARGRGFAGLARGSTGRATANAGEHATGASPLSRRWATSVASRASKGASPSTPRTSGTREDAALVAEHVRSGRPSSACLVLEPQALDALASIAVREGDLDAARELFHRSAVGRPGVRLHLVGGWHAGPSCSSSSWTPEPRRRRARGPAKRFAGGTAIDDRLADAVALVRSRASPRCERAHLERAGRLWGAVLAEMEPCRLRPADALELGALPLRRRTDAPFLVAVAVGRAEGLEAAVELALADAQTEP